MVGHFKGTANGGVTLNEVVVGEVGLLGDVELLTSVKRMVDVMPTVELAPALDDRLKLDEAVLLTCELLVDVVAEPEVIEAPNPNEREVDVLSASKELDRPVATKLEDKGAPRR